MDARFTRSSEGDDIFSCKSISITPIRTETNQPPDFAQLSEICPTLETLGIDVENHKMGGRWVLDNSAVSVVAILPGQS